MVLSEEKFNEKVASNVDLLPIRSRHAKAMCQLANLPNLDFLSIKCVTNLKK